MPGADGPAPGRSTTTVRVALVVYLGLLARITLWPAPADEPVEGPVQALLEWLERSGLGWVDYTVLEAAANVVLFVPFGALLVLLLPPRLWWAAVALPAAVSVGIETTQLLALPRRVPTGWDVVMNTTGAAAGALALWLHGSRSEGPADSRAGPLRPPRRGRPR